MQTLTVATVVELLRKQLLPTFRQSKEKHNDNSKIVLSRCLCLQIYKTANCLFMTEFFKLFNDFFYLKKKMFRSRDV